MLHFLDPWILKNKHLIVLFCFAKSVYTFASPYSLPAFWRSNKATQLAFTVNNTALTTWSCTALTVEKRDQANRKSTLGNHTVTLGGSNVYFYSDSFCSQEITSVDINAPSSSAVVYVSYSAPGNLSYNASSAGLTSASQNTTVTLNPYTWMGGGGNTNWNNAANWHGGVVPLNVAGQVAHFDSNCVTNCSPTINAAVTVRGIHMHVGYSGTITQGSGNTLTVGTSGNVGFIQNSGTFVGGNSDITVSGIFYLQAGNFTSTSAILSISGGTTSNPAFSILGAASFTHNSGTLRFIYHKTINPGNATFFNVNFAGSNHDQNLNGNSMNVAGTLTLSDSSSGGTVINGQILLSGDVVTTSSGKRGNATIRLVGSGNQSISATGAVAYIPALEIASTGGIVSFSGIINTSNNFTYTSGTVNTGTSTYSFNANGILISPGPVVFNNVTFAGDNDIQDLTGSSMIVMGVLTFDDTSIGGDVNNGTILAYGDIQTLDDGKSGTAVLKISGSTNQTVTATGTAAYLPNVEIASTGGTVSFVGFFPINRNFTYTSGSVNMGTSTLSFQADNVYITPGPINFYNVTFAGSYDDQYLNNGTMIVNGLLKLADTSTSIGGVNSGTIHANGDIESSAYGKIGTAVIRATGTSNQTFTGIGANANFPAFEIASLGGTFTLTGNIIFRRSFTYTSGTVVTTGSTLTFTGGPSNGSATLNPGPIQFNNVNFTGTNTTIDLSAGTMTVNGTLTLADSSSGYGFLNNGTILASGSIVGSSYGKRGNALLRMVGSTNQTFTGGTNVHVPRFEIASTGGTVFLTGTLNFSNDYTYTSGTVDTTGSSIRFFGDASSSRSLVLGNFNYNNVEFLGGDTDYNLNGSTANINGTLTISNSTGSIGDINNGTLNAYGNLAFTGGGKGGSATLNLLGSNSITISEATSSSNLFTNWQINKTGGATITLLSNLSVNSAGQSINVVSGTILMNGFNFTVNNTLSLNGNIVTKSSGVLTVGGVAQGTGSILGGTVNP